MKQTNICVVEGCEKPKHRVNVKVYPKCEEHTKEARKLYYEERKLLSTKDGVDPRKNTYVVEWSDADGKLTRWSFPTKKAAVEYRDSIPDKITVDVFQKKFLKSLSRIRK